MIQIKSKQVLTYLANIKQHCQKLGIQIPSDQQLTAIYWPLAQWINKIKKQASRPVVFGISGAQGSGKSTLCGLLKYILESEYNYSVVHFSLDDFYLSKLERIQLAKQLHPLFITRGVPGTHDIMLCNKIIKQLINQQQNEAIFIPRFDKRNDDRNHKWQKIINKIDIVLFDGWCLGAKPQTSEQLIHPINELEKNEDQDGRWRHRVNQFLANEYQTLFKLIDKWINIKINQFNQVFQQRKLQEKKLAACHSYTPMTDAELIRFIMHFQRITESMLIETQPQADIILTVNADHEYHFLNRSI